ncbi:zf-HC2 domain-containing protein, partial [Streptomyces aureus]|uniref:zf-HC2 domain-containing protein n=1 Tax=Streptomyces aureus TaxID=193461 RepID=UPI0020B125B9
MNRQQHEEEELLGPYVLGVLDEAENRRLEAHVNDCAACRQEVSALREMETALGEVPPEAFLDGPPQGGDLLLQRTLRQMRGERASARNRRRGLVGLAAAAALAGVFWAGTATSGAGDPVALPPKKSPDPLNPPRTARVFPVPTETNEVPDKRSSHDEPAQAHHRRSRDRPRARGDGLWNAGHHERLQPAGPGADGRPRRRR